MTQRLTFTIAIPVRNGSNYLADAIRSALKQTRPADEILVVDDNSEDETAAIAKAKEWGDRVKYRFNATPTGFADAWNRAAEKATCDYISILHHDDLLDPEYLSAIEAGLTRFPEARHAFSACRYIDVAGDVDAGGKAPEAQSDEPVLMPGRDYAHRYLLGVFSNRNIHRCPGVTTARSLLTEECAYRKEAGHIADDDFFYRVGAFTDVVGISKPLASYREHGASATGTLESLTAVLARDWVYQARCQRGSSSLFGAEDRSAIDARAVKYLNQLLFHAIQGPRPDWFKQALSLRGELEAMAPQAVRRASPRWARILWWLATRRSPGAVASSYVRLLSWGLQFKRRATAGSRKSLPVRAGEGRDS